MILLVGLPTSFLRAEEASPPAGEPAPAPKSADEATDSVAAPLPARTGDRFQYAGPDTYILLDAEGRPQPVPGMTYEDFLAAWKQSQQDEKSDRQPRFTIEHMDIDGAASEGRAELRFEAVVRLLTDHAVDVPLGLVGSILQGEPHFGPAPRANASSDPTISDGNDTNDTEDLGASGGATDSAAATSVNQHREYLTYDPQRGGFVARLAGRAGERRRIVLHLIVPLLRDGAETSLPLNCPRAVSSKLVLAIDEALAEVSTSSGTLLSQEPTQQGGTKLQVAGAMGSFRLAWQSRDEAEAQLATVLSAVGAIRATIDGRSVRNDARLTVRSYGGSFDRFRVRLPPGAQLRKSPADADTQRAGYRVTIEQGSDAGREPAGPEPAPSGEAQQVVLIELPEKQQGPVTIELSTEQPIGLERDGLQRPRPLAGSVVELAGFEVVGAVRQFGDVALDVADDWQARWDIGPHVRQVDPDELDAALLHPGLTAAFQYDRQSWSLSVRVAVRQSRVHVTPTYELEGLLDDARLSVRLNYQVFGARAFEFRIRMNDWEMSPEGVESGGLVDQERVEITDGNLELPLTQGAPRRGEITLTLRRNVARDNSRIDLALPVPTGDTVGTGLLIIRPSAQVELLPDLENKTLSLLPVTESSDVRRNGHATELRFRTLAPEVSFVADRIHRTREVTTESELRINIKHDAGQHVAEIEQQLAYFVRHEPITELAFEIPGGVELEDVEAVLLPSQGGGVGEPEAAADRGLPLRTSLVDVAAMLGERPVATPLPPPFPAQFLEGLAATRTRQLRVVLPQPHLGRFAVRIAYQVGAAEGTPSGGVWQLPLLQPADGRSLGTRALVQTPRTIAASLSTLRGQTSSWKPAAAQPDLLQAAVPNLFTAERTEEFLPLVLAPAGLDPASETTVERVWLQTWLSAGVRQDRAAFRVRSQAPQVTVELPPQTSPAEVEVLVDGRVADVVARDAGRIVVQFPQHSASGAGSVDAEPARHTLELRSRTRIRDALVTRFQLTPPQIVPPTTLSEVYWHIVLPGDQHVVQSPRRMASASQWQWLGGFWGQRPAITQAELEEWCGASAQLSATAAQNEYLYTGLAPVVSIELVTAPRWLVVLAASASVLVLTILWIYLPLARRGWIIIAVAGLIAGLAVTFPVQALLLGQASVLGMISAAVAMLIAGLATRPKRWPVMLSAGSSQRQPTPRGDSFVMPSVVTAASTSPTVPLRVPGAEE